METPFSFKIGHRSFSFSTDIRIHSYFRFTESTPTKNLTIPLDKILLPWLQECFTRLCELPLTHKFFIETRVQESSVWIEKHSSKNGHSAELAKIDGNGKTHKILIPIGEGKKGWKDFLLTLAAYIKEVKKPTPQIIKTSSSVQPQNRAPSIPSFRDILCKTSSKTTEPSGLELLPSSPISLLSQPTIIIHRKCFHDSWKGIETALRIEYSSSLSINPYQPDKALCFCIDHEQAATMINIKDWYLIGRYWVRFSPQSPELFRAPTFIPSYGGWIKVRDLPLDRWNHETFKLIGDSCGGYLQTAQRTIAKTEMLVAHLKVRTNSFGFLPASLSLPQTPSSTQHFTVWIDPFFSKDANTGYKKRIHGSIPYPTEHSPSSVFAPPNGILGTSPVSLQHIDGVCPPRATTEKLPPSLRNYSFFKQAGHPRHHGKQLKAAESATKSHVLSGSPTAAVPKAAATSFSTFPDASLTPVIEGMGPPKKPHNLSISPLDKEHNFLPNVPLDTLPPSISDLSLFKHCLPTLPISILDEYSNLFHSPTLSAKNPPTLSPSMTNPPLSKGKESVCHKGKAPLFTQGYAQSTNSPFSYSDSDGEYCSSPGLSSPPDSPLSDKALILHSSESVPNLGIFFNECEDFDPLALPLHIAYPTGYQQTLSPEEEDMEKALILGSTEGDYEHSVSCYPDHSEPSLVDNQMRDAPLVNLENPATLLPILIPWLTNLGLCISTIPPIKKSTAAKKKSKGTRELVNLCTSVIYPTKTPSTKRLGASSRTDST